MKANIIGNELKITKNNGEELTCYLSNIALYEFLTNGTVKFFFKFGPFNEVICKLSELYVNGVQSTKSEFENAISSSNTVIDTGGLEKIIANSEMPLSPNYVSPYDYIVTYKTATTLDCIPLNGSPDVDSSICNVVSLIVTRADGSVVKFLHGNLAEDGINKVALSAVGNVLSILNGGTTPFLATDIKYRLGVNYQQKSYDPISDAIKAFVTNYPIQPLHTVLIPPSTSVIADSWFPSKDGVDVSIYKTHTFTGILAPATSQILTIIVEGTNADDLTVDANWTAINFFDVASLTTVKSLATSAGTSTPFNIKITDCGYRNIRFRLTPTVNTNANTCNTYLNSIY